MGEERLQALSRESLSVALKTGAAKPYEFGVKVTVAATPNRCKGGQFAIHDKTPPGWPYDGHMLETVIPEIESLTGGAINPILAAAGYNFRLILKWIRLPLALLGMWMSENHQRRTLHMAA